MVVVGGGIVGLATAREVLQRAGRGDFRLLVIEKEPHLAAHQTGHNSGVLHAGIYYKPGSMKARACVAGRQAMIAYCDEKRIPYDLCGKLVVALGESELPRLDALYERGVANQVPGLERVGPERIREIEPSCQGIAALWSPQTGIVDFAQVAAAYAADICALGGEIVTGCRVERLDSRGGETLIGFPGGEVTAKYVIACAGLHADRVARLGEAGDVQHKDALHIVPFRGDYYTFRPEKRHMVRGLIYPAPDPKFPWLGVHFTKVMNGDVWAGPNAVLAFAREGYRRTDVNLRDVAEALSFPGFWRLAARHWRKGFAEMWRDVVKAAYVKELRRYLPDLREDDLIFGPSGVRAQALDGLGNLVDDFHITYQDRVAHVQNAPSPAATSSLVVARMIVDEVGEWLTG